MVERVTFPRNVTQEQVLEAIRTGVHDAMVERPHVLSAASLLPCLDCRFSGKALEEVAATYAALLHGERPPRELDDRPLPYLPRTCCRQPAAAGAMVAGDPVVAKSPA
jgi:hypothetical protein